MLGIFSMHSNTGVTGVCSSNQETDRGVFRDWIPNQKADRRRSHWESNLEERQERKNIYIYIQADFHLDVRIVQVTYLEKLYGCLLHDHSILF